MTDTIETPDVVIDISENVDSTTTSEAYDATFRDVENIFREFKTAISKLRQLKREIVTMEKSLRKHEERKARRKRASLDENGNKRKNGFSLENNIISDELCDFIGHPKGTPISRSEVTRRLTAYVKEHELQDPQDKRYVNLDTDAGIKLKNLLSEVLDKEGNPCRLTIITINKFISKHYVGKVEKVVEETPSPVEASSPIEESGDKMAASKNITLKKKLVKKKTAAVV